MLKIGFCAGHYLGTPGKRTPDGEREWMFNDTVARNFEVAMSRYEDVVVKRYDDRTGQKDVILETRTNNARKDKVDLYISFHHNANTGKWGTWTGVETYVDTVPNANSMKLANAIHPQLVKAYGLRDRGIKKSNLHITREMERGNSKIGVVLVEGGFMDSTIDIHKLRDNEILMRAGLYMAIGIAEAYGLKLKVGESHYSNAAQEEKPKPQVIAPQPTPQITPQPSKKYLKLPATATSWNIYPTNKAPIKANAIGTLNPKKHGGLTYEILGNPQKDVYTIKTKDYGTVNIYAAKSTGAIIN